MPFPFIYNYSLQILQLLVVYHQNQIELRYQNHLYRQDFGVNTCLAASNARASSCGADHLDAGPLLGLSGTAELDEFPSRCQSWIRKESHGRQFQLVPG